MQDSSNFRFKMVHIMIDRRSFLKSAVGGVLLVRQSSSITRLTDTLSLLSGVGTNVLALSTRDGMILVDSGAPQYNAALLSATSRVQTVFNTHFHLENRGSKEALPKTGAKIGAHETPRQWMAIPYWIPAEDRYEKARPKAAQPTETFYTSGSLKTNAEQ